MNLVKLSAILVPLLLAANGVGAQGMPADSQLCGPLDGGGYGPFDYTNMVHRRENLPVVERHHFNNDVYELRRGMTSRRGPLTDIDYTLRAFPNHHHALDAMARLHLREGTAHLPGGRYSIDCWFERAMRWRPQDGMIRLIYGIYLFRADRLTDSEREMVTATELLPDSPEPHYNLGLLYVRKRDYESARTHAERAYELGHPLPGLRNQLTRLGEWKQGG